MRNKEPMLCIISKVLHTIEIHITLTYVTVYWHALEVTLSPLYYFIMVYVCATHWGHVLQTKWWLMKTNRLDNWQHPMTLNLWKFLIGTWLSKHYIGNFNRKIYATCNLDEGLYMRVLQINWLLIGSAMPLLIYTQRDNRFLLQTTNAFCSIIFERVVIYTLEAITLHIFIHL